MTTPKVWISTTTRDVVLGSASPGSHWQEVGTINTTYEKDLWNNVQVYLGLRRSAPRLNGFYVDGHEDSPWVVEVRKRKDTSPFWLAIDPYGDGSRYLVTIAQASLGALARRPAEPHPGRLDRPIPVGVLIKKRDNQAFEYHRP
ncbi:hypothetical protein [Mycobacterium sp. GA-1285]|uniref:hypothetical protein n=1 Tax=Mycobacterium sp. GA-1285 TaxID=1772282 RepID=UPI0012E34836|nr:hypothetical protein [Mycobacterium sp. GA-1285]